ncbi:DUF1778 domain-containing protein [Frankia sp. Cj3]|uniref:type II toxin-antitoxin system TacA family antitoxin n=1 Tax=Frankia sp. Cj3 TaxID=2880976 RepID=UPI001EF50E77|nr:DUF1778 domain-containing protein [Frankia sp. Cj3]
MSMVKIDPVGTGENGRVWRLLAAASDAAGIPVADFVIAHATRAATDVLADRRLFCLSTEQEDNLGALVAKPPRLPAGLASLLRTAGHGSGAHGFNDIETLASHHRCSAFDCGSLPTTTWLREQALAAARSGRNRVRVIRRGSGDDVAGYYALSSGSLVGDGGQTPVLIISRVGVDLADRHRGVGRVLVADALRQAAYAAGPAHTPILIIHVEDASAREWCRKLKIFSGSPSDPYHLLLRVCDLRLAIPS